MFPAGGRKLQASGLCPQSLSLFRANPRFSLAFACLNLPNLRNLGGNEAQIKKKSRKTQVGTRTDNCEECCAHQITKLRRCVRAARCAYALGQICIRNFPAPDLRNSDSDIFHCIHTRNSRATAVGRRRILVLFAGRDSVANCVLWPSAPDLDLCLWARTHPCALGLAHGRTRQPVSYQP